MSEIPNVIPLEPVTDEWGNAIRDRTVQRYVTAAARSSLHPTPANGDLSYLSDSGLVYVYHSGGWREITNPAHGTTHAVGSSDAIPVDEVDTAGATSAFPTLTGYQSACTATLDIPATWNTYKVIAWVSFTYQMASSGSSQLQALIRIVVDGPQNNIGPSTTFPQSGAIVWRRTGITATGSLPVDFRVRNSAPPTYALGSIFLIAQARRTT